VPVSADDARLAFPKGAGDKVWETLKEWPMAAQKKLAFVASDAPIAQSAQSALMAQYGGVAIEDADIIVALGGDGFMLQTLHNTQHLPAPVYGMNCGTVGFLMNEFSDQGLRKRLDEVEEEVINPLHMHAVCVDGTEHNALAINEVSLLRAGPQAAKLRIHVDGRLRMDELVCDGALLATPAGSTAYNYSAHGPIVPVGSDVLALTAVAAFRPRRWRGALLPKGARVTFEVTNADKRPVNADADGVSVKNVAKVDVWSAPEIEHRILFDPGHGLEERLIQEQFA
jgi:NAD+ kinase